MPSSESDRQLVARIRQGESNAWQECIDLYEGRLIAFARSRMADQSLAEDIIQETFMGFLKALPNYDEDTPLESWLFAIAAHKLIDAMRRLGRRPTIPLIFPQTSGGSVRDPTGRGRAASSLLRSREQCGAEATVVADCLRGLIMGFKSSGSWERLQCVELIFVLGWANKDVARRMNLTEQAVANHKFFVVLKLKEAVKQSRIKNFNLSDLNIG